MSANTNSGTEASRRDGKTSNRAPAPATRRATLAAYLLIGTFLWSVWNESLAPHTLVQGVGLTWLAIFLTSRYFLRADYSAVFTVNPLVFIRFVSVLLLAIFQSGMHAIYITLTGRMQLGVMDLPSDVTDPFHGVLIANAITLTPGTVTIEHVQGRYKVVWIECLTDDPREAGEMIKGRFERVFLRPARRKETA